MLIIVYIFMFIASGLLFWLLSISQIGTNWEVPIVIIQKYNFALVLSSLFTVLSVILLLISRNKLFKMGYIVKLSLAIWYAVIIIILILGWSKLFYRIPAISSSLSLVLRNSFIPGMILSCIAMLELIIASKK